MPPADQPPKYASPQVAVVVVAKDEKNCGAPSHDDDGDVQRFSATIRQNKHENASMSEPALSVQDEKEGSPLVEEFPPLPSQDSSARQDRSLLDLCLSFISLKSAKETHKRILMSNSRRRRRLPIISRRRRKRLVVGGESVFRVGNVQNMTRAELARRWLGLTTSIHAIGGTVLLFVAMFVYVSLPSLVHSGPLGHSLIFRICTISAATISTKSCRGRQLSLTKILRKLPGLLCTKAIDACASVLVWSNLLPLMVASFLNYEESSAMRRACFSMLAMVCSALDLLSTVASWQTVRNLCSSLPEDVAVEHVEQFTHYV